MHWRPLALFGIAAVLLTPVVAPAESEDEIVRNHIAAIGGAARIGALTSYRAVGKLIEAGQQIPFIMTAARPNRMRMELRYPDRTLVQATDGTGSAWEIDTSKHPTRSTPMTGAAAREFLSEADFDDPLVAGEKHGYRLLYAGEQKFDGARVLRVLVTQNLTETFYLLVDPEAYLIVARIDQTLTAAGPRPSIITRYRNFRAVGGVLVAHQVSIYVDGMLTQEAKIEEMIPNPSLPSDTFTAPAPDPAKT